MPSTGLLAVAYILRGMRPERYASRPAITACRMASAICTGCSAPGDRRVHQHAVGPELHRQRGVGCRAHAGVHDDRHLRELADDPDVVGVLDAQAQTRSARPAASPPRPRPPPACGRRSGRRWCRAAPRSRPSPAPWWLRSAPRCRGRASARRRSLPASPSRPGPPRAPACAVRMASSAV